MRTAHPRNGRATRSPAWLPLPLLALVACEVPGEYGRGEPSVGRIDSAQVVCPAGGTVEGVDVSHWQGLVDWAKVKAAGVDFAIFKATEHTMFFDSQFDNNWKNTKANGVIRGAYHFFRPSYDPVQQADWFISKAGIPGDGDLPLTLDLEVTDGLAGADVAKKALAFLQRVEDVTGRLPIVYTGPSFFNNTLGAPAGFAKYPLWIAHWGVNCPNIPNPPWPIWHFWQYTDAGTVNGIAGNVDRDRWNGTLADLKKFVTVVKPPDMSLLPDLSRPADLAHLADLSSRTDLSRPADLLAGNADQAGAPVMDMVAPPPVDLAAALGADLPGPTGVVTGCACRASGRPGGDEGGGLAGLSMLSLLGALARRRRAGHAGAEMVAR